MKNRKAMVLSGLAGAAIGARLAGFRVGGGAGGNWFDRGVTSHWEYVAAAIGWVLFSIYWEVTARKASADKKAESDVSRGIHVLLANAAVLLELIPFRGAARAWALSTPVMWAGLAVEAMGLGLAIWARRRLGRNWSGRITIKTDHELVRSGPYQVVRHPIYTGILGMYVGTALVTGTWLAMAGLAIAGFAYWRKIRLEEVNLEVAFGGEYAAYRRETWALVPGLF